MQGFMRDVYPALQSGAIKPVIDRVFDFDELPAAKAYMETDQLLGKVVVRMP
jgi:NADPH:quinone reductase-like Zn-dependent oxidoreductase